MKNRVAITVILIFFFCLTIIARSNIEIRMGVTVGMAERLRKLFVELYKEAGANVVIKELPTARIMNAFDTGTIDAVLFASEYVVKNRERCILIGLDDHEPLFTFKLYGYVLATRVVEFNNAVTYKNYIIAHIQGNQAHENAIAELGARPVPVPDLSNALNMLATGRIDMIMAVPGALTDYFALTGIDSTLVTMIQKPLVSFNYYHVLNNRYVALAESLRKVFKKNREALKKMFSGS